MRGARSDRRPVTLGRHLRGAFGFLVALLLLCGSGGLLALMVTARSTDALVHRIEPLERANARALQALTDGETGLRGFTLTGRDEFLEPYRQGRAAFPQAIGAARRLAAGERGVLHLLHEEDEAGSSWLTGFAEPRAAGTGRPGQPGVLDQDEGKREFDGFRRANQAVAVAAAQLKADRQDDVEASALWARRSLVAMTLLALALAGVVASRTTRAVIGPLDHVRRVLARLHDGDLGARTEPTGPTEVRAVAESVNALAARGQELTEERLARDEREQVIDRVARHIREHLDLQTVLDRSVKALGPLLQVHRVFLRLVQEGELGPIAAEWEADGIEPLGHDGGPMPPLMAGLTVEHRSTLVAHDVGTSPDLDEETRRAMLFVGARSAVAAPLFSGPNVIGVLGLHDCSGPRTWAEGEVAVIEAVAREVGAALGHAQAYEQERVLVQRLRELDRAKTDFVSSVSHELRTPLTSIVGYLEMLEEGDAGPLGTEQARMIEVVERNARRLLSLIEDLLTLSRIESGAFRVSMSPVDTADLVASAHEALVPLLAEHQVHFGHDVAPGTGWALGDRAQLERVLLNLLSNAIKFTPPGGQVTLSTARAGGEVVVRVSDTGIGIPVEEQDRLFTRFFRSSSAHERAIRGTGLGLVIVKNIVEHHGGSIDVESAPGVGTTVTFTLPVAETPVPDERRPQTLTHVSG